MHVFSKSFLVYMIYENGFEGPCWADSPATSFPLIPLCQGTHINGILVCSTSLTRDWWQSKNNLELSGSYQGHPWLPECREEYKCSYLCSSFLYSPLCKPCWHIYFILEYCGVEPKSEAVPSSGVPSIHPSKSTFFGLGSACVLDQAPFLVWVGPVLPLTLFRKRDCECLVECISWKHRLRPCM